MAIKVMFNVCDNCKDKPEYNQEWSLPMASYASCDDCGLGKGPNRVSVED